MAYGFAALIGLASLAFAMLLAMRRLKTAEDRIANAVARKQAQSERIRRAARASLQEARELRDTRRRRNSIEFACEDLEQRLKASAAVDRRLFVLDDRRTQADVGWIVKVSNPDYGARLNVTLDKGAQESWKRGRRFLVWGLDEKKAREKMVARYPDQKGFTILSVQQHLG
jgi:hypothetical protein